MGPTGTGGNCSTVGSRTLEKSNNISLDYFICGFAIKISDNQTAEPGVYSIAPFYATIGEKIFQISYYSNHCPGRGGQTEVTPNHTIFERTHVPGALELHGLKKASSSL